MQVTHSAVKPNGSTSKLLFGGILNESPTQHKCIEIVCSRAIKLTKLNYYKCVVFSFKIVPDVFNCKP